MLLTWCFCRATKRDATNDDAQDFKRRFFIASRAEIAFGAPNEAFYIASLSSRIIAFCGRALDESALAKYLNSPETPLFQKRRELYGVPEASTIKSSNEVWVVEGHMDVVSLASHGMRNCVATPGIAVTAYHISSLFRMSDKIVFCFDGDAAGQRAALAASTVLLPLFKDGKDVWFLSLPENQDPDDLVKEQGPSAFDSNQAVPLSRFVLQNLAAGVLLENPEGHTQLVARARKLLLPLPKTIFKNLSHGGACQKSRQPAADLALRPSRTLLRASPQKSPRQHQYNSARAVITYLLHKPSRVKDPQAAVIEKTGIKGDDLLAKIVSTINRRLAKEGNHYVASTHHPRVTEMTSGGASDEAIRKNQCPIGGGAFDLFRSAGKNRQHDKQTIGQRGKHRIASTHHP